MKAIRGLLASVVLVLPGLLHAQSGAVHLTVTDEIVTIKGKQVAFMMIKNDEDGSQGYSPNQSDGFAVAVSNQLGVPTAIHWHGLILPNSMDGVPFVTQNPIQPGEMIPYAFPLQQAGTYWMHSHYGLQEQRLNSAPLVIWSEEEKAKADVQHVVMLSDFTFTPSAKVLEKLKAGMPMKDGMKEPKPVKLATQAWDETAGKFTRKEGEGAPPDIDVKYDALLANRHTAEEPDVVTAKPGQTVLLRLIAASSATDFFVDTGKLDAELLAVDGQPVEPLKGNFFQLAIAQRLDLRVTIPEGGGAFPILFQGEGTKLQAGIVIKTEDAKTPKLASEAETLAGGLDNTQEKLLRAPKPLEAKPVDKSFPIELGGDMAKYVWTINGKAYPNRDSLDVKLGERVEFVMTNKTTMGHPMHLHGHVFQVTEIDGQPVSGALRDTVDVPPGSTIKIAFDANNPGIWAFHCHILYHLATGMFTVLKYEGADTSLWQPEKTFTEFLNL